jgi:hypothetical protein
MAVSCFDGQPPFGTGRICVQGLEITLGLMAAGDATFAPEASDDQRFIDCAGQSNSCTTLLVCASHGHNPDWCNAHPNGGCDGDTLITCAGGWGLQQQDCAAKGAHCGTANGASVCTNGNACNFNTLSRCDGNLYVECDSATQLEKITDCGAEVGGATCQTMTANTSRTVGCFPPAPTAICPMDSAACDGTVSVLCRHGAQTRLDCAQFASHCQLATDGEDAYCMPDATACTVESPDTCDGDSLQTCVNGNYQSTSCSSIGLTTCQNGRCQ